MHCEGRKIRLPVPLGRQEDKSWAMGGYMGSRLGGVLMSALRSGKPERCPICVERRSQRRHASWGACSKSLSPFCPLAWAIRATLGADRRFESAGRERFRALAQVFVFRIGI